MLYNTYNSNVNFSYDSRNRKLVVIASCIRRKLHTLVAISLRMYILTLTQFIEEVNCDIISVRKKALRYN